MAKCKSGLPTVTDSVKNYELQLKLDGEGWNLLIDGKDFEELEQFEETKE